MPQKGGWRERQGGARDDFLPFKGKKLCALPIGQGAESGTLSRARPRVHTRTYIYG